jgi:agmatine deiminase
MKYPDWKKDDAVAETVAKILKLDMLRARRDGHDIVFEGGGVDVNGRGTLLTAEEWFLDSEVQVRNPDFSRRELEQVLCDYVGVSNIVWLGKGIVGDDAHGHVDNVCRFVGPRTVVLCQEKNPRDPNCEPLHENRERLANQRLEDGSRIEVVPLPMPTPLHFNGKRLPASYANFYVSNAVVLVPTFNDPQDRMALGILGELFRDRTVVGIHAVDLIWGLGSLHCITQQQPQL